jgi:Ferritin-like domain
VTVAWTRAGFVRAALGGAAVIAGGAATSLASRSSSADEDILNFFLLFEHVQAAFYRRAIDGGRLSGELQEFASTVAGQEAQHVAFLKDRLGNAARQLPTPHFGNALSSPDRFRDTAVELEELAIAGYIGQAPHLSRASVAKVATLVSVEARQAAWIRDIAGVSPAPRAADPARGADNAITALRKKGFVQ